MKQKPTVRRQNGNDYFSANTKSAVMVKNLQNEISFRTLNHLVELNSIQNSVLVDTGRKRQKIMKET